MDFISRFAPHLAARSLDGMTDGGMPGPDDNHPYDNTGTPLPYMQNAGSPRQYFGIPGLRGTLPVDNAPPTSGMAGPTVTDDTQNGSPFLGRVDDHEGDDLRGLTDAVDGLRGRYDQPQDVGTPNGTRATLPIPPYDPRVIEDQIVKGIQTGHIDPITPDRVVQGMAQQGETLDNLLARYGFSLPTFFPRDEERHSAPKSSPRPRDYLSNANTLGELPDFTSGQGMAEFNRRMGLNLGPQVRSQAAQDQLVNRGATSNRVSWHTYGRAADIRPQDLGGLTGHAAVNEVRRRLTAAGYPDMEVIWESGHGRNQGTGAHVHIEPHGKPQ